MFFTNPESTNLQFFLQNYMVRFLEGCKMSFNVMINCCSGIFENFYLVEKQNKENFMEKFVDSGIVKTCDELDLGSDLDICEAESCSPAVKETYF